MIASASVVLPEPLSPTTPSVSPARIATSAPSTAFTYPAVRRRKPRRIGNHTFRPSVSTIVSGDPVTGSGTPAGSASSSIFV